MEGPGFGCNTSLGSVPFFLGAIKTVRGRPRDGANPLISDNPVIARPDV